MKKIIAFVCLMIILLPASVVMANDIKVVVALDLTANGENTLVVGASDYYEDKYDSRGVRLKDLILAGWSIVYIEKRVGKYSTNHLIILEKK